MYKHGRGIAHNNAKAVDWYRKAAEQGHAGAQNQIGLLYAEGRGVPRDDEVAFQWFRRAAEQGHASGQNNLGWFYERGRGVERDLVLAYAWFNLAAYQRNPNALRNRDILVQELTPDEILEAVRLSTKWRRWPNRR